MEEKINFKYYLTVLLEQRKIIAIVMLIIFIPFYFLSLKISYYYESYALVEILHGPYELPYDSDQPLFGNRSPGTNIPKMLTKLKTIAMAEAFLSRLSPEAYKDFEDELTFKEKVVYAAKKLIGANRVNAIKQMLGRPLSSPIDSSLYKKMILDNFRTRLDITYAGDELIKIKMTSEKAYAAYECVTKFLALWQEQNLAEKQNEIIAARQFLEKFKTTAQAEVEKKEKQLRRYKNKLGLNYGETPLLGPEEMKTLTQLENELAVTQKQFDLVTSKLLDIEIKFANIKGDLKIIEPPRLDLTASGASRLKIKILGLVLGFGFGCGLVIIRRLLDSSVKSEDELKRMTAIPIIGVLPRYEQKNIFGESKSISGQK